jgi:hypothetical protein
MAWKVNGYSRRYGYPRSTEETWTGSTLAELSKPSRARGPAAQAVAMNSRSGILPGLERLAAGGGLPGSLLSVLIASLVP